MIKRALISVSDKLGILELAKGLHEKGIEIISTGGTAKAIADEGIPVTPIEEVTKFPECFDGRVKTMHPLVMGGVLFRRGDDSHAKQAAELGIEPIDLVIVNLYPFEEGLKNNCENGVCTPSNPEANPEEFQKQVELIDIGGPTLLRSAAKNHESVTVVTDPNDYDQVIAQIKESGDTTPELRTELAAKVFARTAAYDSAIADYVSGGENKGLMLRNRRELRYGENPHQWGAFYEIYNCHAEESPKGTSRSTGWKVLQEEKPFGSAQGKLLSYLNILDADGAWNLVSEFKEPTAACIKHANPSGVASHENIAEAFQRCYDADRLSAFGVIIALNRTCPKEVVEKIIEQKIFAEIIIAPGYDADALELLKEKPKLRVIEMNNPSTGSGEAGKWKMENDRYTYRSMLGGMLVQNEDNRVVTEMDLQKVTSKKPSTEQLEDLLFAWKVVKHSKSNAIVFAKDKVTVGIGCGQTSRVDSTWIAAKRAGDRAKGAVMASDAFFPFPDSVEEAAKHGIVAIIQPGGSIRDKEVFAKAEEEGIAMVTTGIRAFRH